MNNEKEIYFENNSLLPFGFYIGTDNDTPEGYAPVPTNYLIKTNKTVIVEDRHIEWASKDGTAIIIGNILFSTNQVEVLASNWYHCTVVAEIEND